eukprot:15113855-Ditylum_brightwellii.AAC.1
MLRIHPKTAAQMVATSKVKGCNAMMGFHYWQWIPLPREVSRDFATKKDGGEVFHGTKFIMYPDGSTFLHAECIVKRNDSHCPEERMLMPSVLKSVRISPPNAENEEKTSNGAHIFATRSDSDDHEAHKDAKRA